MKLNLKISQSTNIEPSVVKGIIQLKLKDKKYRVIGSDSLSITFDDMKTWFVSNAKATRRLDGGTFEITTSDTATIVTFSYYLNLIPQILILATLTIILIINGEYYAPLFFLVFYLIAATIQVFISKEVAKQLLNEIINYSIDN